MNVATVYARTADIKALAVLLARVPSMKPQFEIGKGKVEKGGLVRKKESHQEVLLSVWHKVEELGLRVRGITYSPVKGDKGNMEFFLYLTSKGRRVGPKRVEEKVSRIVDEAHEALGSRVKVKA